VAKLELGDGARDLIRSCRVLNEISKQYSLNIDRSSHRHTRSHTHRLQTVPHEHEPIETCLGYKVSRAAPLHYHAAAFATLAVADCTPPLSNRWHQSPNASGKLVPGAFCRVAL